MTGLEGVHCSYLASYRLNMVCLWIFYVIPVAVPASEVTSREIVNSPTLPHTKATPRCWDCAPSLNLYVTESKQNTRTGQTYFFKTSCYLMVGVYCWLLEGYKDSGFSFRQWLTWFFEDKKWTVYKILVSLIKIIMGWESYSILHDFSEDLTIIIQYGDCSFCWFNH